MSILSDRWIREQATQHGMIEPFVEAQRRDGCISYGLSSYGYDARVSDEFKIFTNVDNAIVDPKDFASNSFVDRRTDVCIIPPNSFALARTVEYFRVPRSCHPGVLQHDAAARPDLRQRGRLPVPVPGGQRALRSELRRPRR
jgi:deoxycytidine triphosphate deaminase